MRWNKKPRPVEGDIREVRKFLFFPRTLKGKVRWLEFAIIREVYEQRGMGRDRYDQTDWWGIDFVND